MLTRANVPHYTFSDLKNLMDELTEVRKENVSLKLDLQHFKLEVLEARKMVELDSKSYFDLKKYFKRGEK